MFNKLSKFTTVFRNLLQLNMCIVYLLVTIRLDPNFTLSGFNTFKASTAEEIKENIKKTSNIHQEYINSIKTFIDKNSAFISEQAETDFKKIANEFNDIHHDIMLIIFYFLFQQDIKNVQSVLNMFLEAENIYSEIFLKLCERLEQTIDQSAIQVAMEQSFKMFEFYTQLKATQLQDFEKENSSKCDFGLMMYFFDTVSKDDLFHSTVTDLMNKKVDFYFMKSYCKGYATFLLKHHRFNILFIENLKEKMLSRK